VLTAGHGGAVECRALRVVMVDWEVAGRRTVSGDDSEIYSGEVPLSCQCHRNMNFDE
jgi:hypothetical protein